MLIWKDWEDEHIVAMINPKDGWPVKIVRDDLDFITDLAPVFGDILTMAKHPNRIKSTNKVMKQAKARSIKRSGFKPKPKKGK